jgi:hypothetical protein
MFPLFNHHGKTKSTKTEKKMHAKIEFRQYLKAKYINTDMTS